MKVINYLISDAQISSQVKTTLAFWGSQVQKAYQRIRMTAIEVSV